MSVTEVRGDCAPISGGFALKLFVSIFRAQENCESYQICSEIRYLFYAALLKSNFLKSKIKIIGSTGTITA